MSFQNKVKGINPKIKEKFIKEYLHYHRQNITITELLHYNTLLNEEYTKQIEQIIITLFRNFLQMEWRENLNTRLNYY